MSDPTAACTGEQLPEKAAPVMIPEGLSSDSFWRRTAGDGGLQSRSVQPPTRCRAFTQTVNALMRTRMPSGTRAQAHPLQS